MRLLTLVLTLSVLSIAGCRLEVTIAPLEPSEARESAAERWNEAPEGHKPNPRAETWPDYP